MPEIKFFLFIFWQSFYNINLVVLLVAFLTVNICRKLRTSVISSSQWDISLVKRFWVIWRKAMHTRKALDFWGLHKNMNCAFPSKLGKIKLLKRSKYCFQHPAYCKQNLYVAWIYRCFVVFRAYYTAQKIKFSIKNFSSKCDQIRRFLRNWSHLLEKSLMGNFIFCAALRRILKVNIWHLWICLIKTMKL